jgi:hypothetical protein
MVSFKASFWLMLLCVVAYLFIVALHSLSGFPRLELTGLSTVTAVFAGVAACLLVCVLTRT